MVSALWWWWLCFFVFNTVESVSVFGDSIRHLASLLFFGCWFQHCYCSKESSNCFDRFFFISAFNLYRLSFIGNKNILHTGDTRHKKCFWVPTVRVVDHTIDFTLHKLYVKCWMWRRNNKCLDWSEVIFISHCLTFESLHLDLILNFFKFSSFKMAWICMNVINIIGN